VRIGIWPVMNAALPAVQLAWAYASGEHQTLSGDPVDIGRFGTHQTSVIGAHVQPADIIGHDQQHVRLVGCHRLLLFVGCS
jgi:hypothetical protein